MVGTIIGSAALDTFPAMRSAGARRSMFREGGGPGT